jgi:chromosome segregation ATPase
MWQAISPFLTLLGFPMFGGMILTWLLTKSNLRAQTTKLAAEAEKVESEKKKLDSEISTSTAGAVKIITESAAALVNPLRTELAETRDKLKEANRQIDALNERVEEVVAKLDDANARADAAEATNRLLQRQLANINRTRNPRETDR